MLNPNDFKRAIQTIDALGATPAALVKVTELAADPNTDLSTICSLLRNDGPLAADIIRIANSPYYAPAIEQPIMLDAEDAPNAGNCPSTPPPLRILVVDDEPVFQLVIRRHLEEMGFPVAVAENGRVALKLCREFMPNVVVLDMFMPEMEGIETIPALKRIDPSLQILAISGGGIGGLGQCLKTARLLGAQHILKKPFTRTELSAAISAITQQVLLRSARAIY